MSRGNSRKTAWDRKFAEDEMLLKPVAEHEAAKLKGIMAQLTYRAMTFREKLSYLNKTGGLWK